MQSLDDPHAQRAATKTARIMATTAPCAPNVVAPLEGAVSTLGVAEAIVPFEPAVLPLVGIAEFEEFIPVALLGDIIAEMALMVEDMDISELLLILIAEDAGAETELNMAVGAAVEALTLGVVDATVFELSTTNCGL